MYVQFMFLVQGVDRHAPRKIKLLRGNEKHHIDENFVVKLNKETKIEYFENGKNLVFIDSI